MAKELEVTCIENAKRETVSIWEDFDDAVVRVTELNKLCAKNPSDEHAPYRAVRWIVNAKGSE